MTETKSVWPTVIVGVVLLLVLIYGFAVINSNIKDKETPKVDLTSVISAINANSAKIDALTTSLAVPESIPEVGEVVSEYTLTKKEYERETTEAKALELATEFVNSKDFKKAVFKILNESTFGFENGTIESYKDITNVKIDDTEVDRVEHSDAYEVTFENVKVYYFVDGDEEETEKALLGDFIVTVDDVDFDDEFVDAEVNEPIETLVVSKVY